MKQAIQQRIAQVREFIHQSGVDALIVLPNDPHQSEYVTAHWQTRQWLSGFTGSAGTLVITSTFAGLWTDSRYFIQAENQLADTGIELMRLVVPHTPEYIGWLCDNLRNGATVGVDGNIISAGFYEHLVKSFLTKHIHIETNIDVAAALWTDRPALPSDPVMLLPTRYAGQMCNEKIDDLRKTMQQRGIDHHLITTLDDIAWLFNIRGNDVDYTPLTIAYSIISQTDAVLFVDKNKISDEVRASLVISGVKIEPYENILQAIEDIPWGHTLLFWADKINKRLYDAIPPYVIKVQDINITTPIKARKNPLEQEHLRNAMVKDGVALVKFFRWLEQNAGREGVTEMTALEKVEEYRTQQANYIGPSFHTIAAWNEHAALPHYHTSPENDVPIGDKGIFLLDTGSQYLDGTTDITRTVAIGNPTAQQRRDFTLVLKGHIAVAAAKFPYGTRGYQIDTLARVNLWNNNLNYGHGTGHGVGFFLAVHEGPQNIGTSPVNVAIESGMLTSNEPGLYRVGQYGIRIENLILAKEAQKTDFGQFMQFETVSIFPIDKKLIDRLLLTSEEINWINEYHRNTFERLSSLLNDEERRWLREKTLPI